MLWARLAESGTSIRSAPASSACSAPLRFGTSTDTRRPGSVFACATAGRIGQLREQARRHERSDLDFALAGRIRVADPLDLPFRRKNARDALQPVAQADFAYDCMLGNDRMSLVSVDFTRVDAPASC